MDFSDYIVFADESGSPVLTADLKDYPIFVLVFLVIRKDEYAWKLLPSLTDFKLKTCGHDSLVLHERDIRRQSGDFAFLQISREVREKFLDELTSIVDGTDFKLACTIIDKTKLAQRYDSPWDPYDLALTFCLEKCLGYLWDKGQQGTIVDIVFEARGAVEDAHLELEFRRIVGGNPRVGKAMKGFSSFDWRPQFADKKSNSVGLQIADLAARPLGLRYLRPTQTNRAADLLRKKMIFPHPKMFP